MFWNYLISSIRHLSKNKLFSIINIVGFSVGLAVVILIIFWISFEASYDKFHKNSERIYRVTAVFNKNGRPDHFSHTPAPLGMALKNNFPEVEDVVRFGYYGKELVKYNQNEFWEVIDIADPSIFNVFSFSLLKGNVNEALSNPNNIVLSERIARKFFGNVNPLGKSLTIGKNDKREFVVSGILQNVPANSQLQFDMLIPFSVRTHHLLWKHWNYTTYILGNKDFNSTQLEQKLPAFLEKYIVKTDTKLHLQPFNKIHLFSDLRNDLRTNTHISKIFIYASIGLIILVLASINYINLTLARSATRNKEIGIRKIIGARKKQLRLQFLSESFIVTCLSFLFAIPLMYVLLPIFREFINKEILITQLVSFRSILIFLLMFTVIGLINGLYPAFYLSKLKPLNSFKNISYKKSKILPSLNKALVVFQFTIAIFFICATLGLRNQLVFMQSTDLGYEKEQIIVLPIFYDEVNLKYSLLKSELLKNHEILNVSATSFFPTDHRYNQNARWEDAEGKIVDGRMSWIAADYDFIKTMDLKLLNGKDFSKEIQTGNHKAYIVNDNAVKKIGWNYPIEKKLDIVGKGKIIGVVNDFHFESLHSEIEPVAMTIYESEYKYLYIKTNTGQIASALKYIEEKWNMICPDRIFEYSFLDIELDNVYKKEIKEGRIYGSLSILSIILSCLGILGLSCITVINRTKEIGIRKVNGAKIGEILYMLNKTYFSWMLIALVIACPLAYILLFKWLQNFAYKAEIHFWIFIGAGIIALIITLITVSWQSLYAARKNPVEALKYE